MPDALPLTGLFGKVPAHGDFVRRGLPSRFVAAWDDWLQAGMARARDGLGPHWAPAWDTAPAWRFALPAGACGPDAVAGVMLPSADAVGRRFPITLAALLPAGAPPPEDAWFDALEAAAVAGRDGAADADALAAAIPLPGVPLPAPAYILPAMVGDLPGAMPGACPPEEALPPGGREEPADMLGLPAGPLTHPVAAPGEEDVLALLGAGRMAEEPPPLGSGAVTGDILAAFTDPAPAATRADPLPEPDGTLAALIGAADRGSQPDQPALEDPPAALPQAPSAPMPEWAAAEAPAELPAVQPAQAPADPAPAAWAPAPPAPEGGGWWTRGAAHVPPMVWALPALPAPEEFAYLLEAEA